MRLFGDVLTENRDFDEFLPILQDEDFTAAEKFLSENDNWIKFKNGDEVYVDNYLEYSHKKGVRKPGEIEKWWVIDSAVVC